MDEKTNLCYNGLFCNSPEFAAFLERWFENAGTHEDDKWWVRDWLSDAWNAAIDAAQGVLLDMDQRRARAIYIDSTYNICRSTSREKS